MFQVLAHVVGNAGVAELDLVKELRPIFGIERRQSNYHLIYQGAQTPPVHRLAMPLLVQNLRCQIFRSATDREGIVFSDFHFGETKVSEPQIPNLIDQDILRLKTK
jgi:hypothetical protein